MNQYTLSKWAGEEQIYAVSHAMGDTESYVSLLKQRQSSLNDLKAQCENIDSIQENSFHQPPAYNIDEIHTHADFVELFYVVSGFGVAFFNGTKRMIQKGDLVCVQIGERHSNYPLSQVKVYNCLISASLIGRNGPLFQEAVSENGRLNMDTFIHLSGNTLIEVENLFSLLLQESVEKQPYYQDALVNYVNRLLLSLCRFQKLHKTQVHYHRAMSPILDYVAENFRTVTLTELAAFGSYNATYLSKLFHETLGVNFTEYVNRLRIDEAVKLVLTTDRTIDEICQTVGFKSRLHFYEVFKKHTGFTPGVLRKQ